MKKILVIEDDSSTRNLLLSCLTAEGYDSIGAADGTVGIEAAQKQLPDLLICDVLMPRLDGYSVLDALRCNSLTAEIPFIFLTASLTKAELPTSSKSEVYLSKPATVERLLETIVTCLDQGHNQQIAQTHPALTASESASSIFPETGQLGEVFDFIEANYHRPISLNDVAQAAGYSPAYLTNLVGCQTGLTVRRWITERRLIEVTSLLQCSDWSIDQIAHTVGYASVRHLFRQFRKRYGTTPQSWRKQHQ